MNGKGKGNMNSASQHRAMHKAWSIYFKLLERRVTKITILGGSVLHRIMEADGWLKVYEWKVGPVVMVRMEKGRRRED